MTTARPRDVRLPAYLAPLPRRLERLGLRYAWVIVAINLLGTVFGVWYYRPQLTGTALVMWPVVPDSPLATLFMAASLASWKVGRGREWLHALAFCGNLKYGSWVVFVQLAINDPATVGVAYYWFLVVGHLGMAAQAFLVVRYATFPTRAVALAAGWFTVNDVTDYFLPIVGDFHHTFFGTQLVATGDHSVPAHDFAAAAAVGLTILGLLVALAVRIERLERRTTGG